MTEKAEGVLHGSNALNLAILKRNHQGMVGPTCRNKTLGLISNRIPRVWIGKKVVMANHPLAAEQRRHRSFGGSESGAERPDRHRGWQRCNGGFPQQGTRRPCIRLAVGSGILRWVNHCDRNTTASVRSRPAEALWGAVTQRSVNNFAIGDQIPLNLIYALARIKQCCAVINARHGLLDQPSQPDRTSRRRDPLRQHDDQFFSASGRPAAAPRLTNVNEVISNLAAKYAGEPLGSHHPVHPNDHINRSQSTNDAFPAAIHVAAAGQLKQTLLPELEQLIISLDAKAASWMDIIKIGRTHLQDAVPLRLSDEVSAWRDQLKSGVDWMTTARNDLLALPLGGTAVGSGLNTPEGFADAVCAELAQRSGDGFHPATNLFAVMASHDALVQAMAQLRRLAVTLLKMANDIRLLACGPRAGLGELVLPANEPGSSIMPGKVNPTQCEAMAMVCTQVIGMDAAVAAAGAGGHLQMNVYKPLIGTNLLQAITLLSDACRCFRLNMVDGMEPNRERIGAFVDRSLMLVTALTPEIGYENACTIANHAHQQGLTLREAALQLSLISEENFDRLINPAAMARPHG